MKFLESYMYNRVFTCQMFCPCVDDVPSTCTDIRLCLRRTLILHAVQILTGNWFHKALLCQYCNNMPHVLFICTGMIITLFWSGQHWRCERWSSAICHWPDTVVLSWVAVGSQAMSMTHMCSQQSGEYCTTNTLILYTYKQLHSRECIYCNNKTYFANQVMAFKELREMEGCDD